MTKGYGAARGWNNRVRATSSNVNSRQLPAQPRIPAVSPAARRSVDPSRRALLSPGGKLSARTWRRRVSSRSTRRPRRSSCVARRPRASENAECCPHRARPQRGRHSGRRAHALSGSDSGPRCPSRVHLPSTAVRGSVVRASWASSPTQAYHLRIDSLTPPGFGPPSACGRRGLG